MDRVFLRKCTQCANLVHCWVIFNIYNTDTVKVVLQISIFILWKHISLCQSFIPYVSEEQNFPNEYRNSICKIGQWETALVESPKGVPNPASPPSLSTKCSHPPLLFIPSLWRSLDPHCPLTKIENYCKTKTLMKFENGRQKVIILEYTRNLTTPSAASLDLLKKYISWVPLSWTSQIQLLLRIP